MTKIEFYIQYLKNFPQKCKIKLQKRILKKANDIILANLSEVVGYENYYDTPFAPFALSSPLFTVVAVMQNKWKYPYRYFRITGITVDCPIGIESYPDKVIIVTIHTQRPGIIIGKGGEDIDDLKLRLETVFQRKVEILLKETK